MDLPRVIASGDRGRATAFRAAAEARLHHSSQSALEWFLPQYQAEPGMTALTEVSKSAGAHV